MVGGNRGYNLLDGKRCRDGNLVRPYQSMQSKISSFQALYTKSGTFLSDGARDALLTTGVGQSGERYWCSDHG